MTDRETLDIYDARAQDYADNFCQGFEPDEHLSAFMEALPDGADVLDLGCGPGRSAAILAKAGHRVTATDASAEMVRIASQHDSVTVRQESFDDIAGTDWLDGVWANFSLLHADRADLPRYIGAIAAALRAGGVFHIGMKTGAGTERDQIGRRYTYVSEDELRTLLDAAGITPHAVWHGEDVGMAGTMDAWIIMQARKDA